MMWPLKQKNSILITVTLLLMITQAKAQYIVTGQHFCEDHYVSFNPVKLIPANTIYNLDLDGDLQADFKIQTNRYTGLGPPNPSSYILPMGLNQIAFGKVDSSFLACDSTWLYYQIPKAFSINDTINSAIEWRNSNLEFCGNGIYVFSNGSFCSFGTNGIAGNNKYIGLRVINSTDTLYGWVKFKLVSSGYLELEEIACEVKHDEIAFLHNINDTTVQCGTQFEFNLNVGSKSCTNYQWIKNGTDIPGADNSTLTLGNITFNDTGLYQCQVRNAFDTAYCSSRLSVANQGVIAPPYITQSDQVICGGHGLSMLYSLEKGQNTILSYQWSKDGIDLTGETNDSLLLTDINDDRTGKFTCQLSILEVNYCLDTTYTNTIITNAVTLTVNQIPYPVITQIGNRLISNYSTGNTWLYSTETTCCELLSYESEININRDGRYLLNVSLTGCGSNTNWKDFYVQFTVNPNPVKDQITITLNPEQRDVKWELINELGIKVAKGQFFNPVNILDLSEFSTGIYFLKVDKKVVKIIKQ